MVGAPAEHGALPVSKHALPTRVGRASVAAGVRAPVVEGAGEVASEGEVVGRVLTAGRRRERGRHAVLRTRARGRRARERIGVTRARGRASARARRGAAAASVDSASVERRCRAFELARRRRRRNVTRIAASGLVRVARHPRVRDVRGSGGQTIDVATVEAEAKAFVRHSLENEPLHPLALEREQHVEVPRQHADLELRVPLAQRVQKLRGHGAERAAIFPR